MSEIPESFHRFPFIDWLSIRQYHSGQFKSVNDGCIVRYDADGAQVYTTDLSLKAVGSHDSSLQIRITDSLVELSFNPSRWSRRDNLFGRSIEQSLQLVDTILASLDQPPLDPGQVITRNDGSTGVVGAVITRLDVTENYTTGSAYNLTDYLVQKSRIVIGRLRTQRKFNTVYYQSKLRTLKIYPKHKELRQQQIPKATTERQKHHLQQLSDRCESLGLARHEVRMNHDYLRRSGLRASGAVTSAKVFAQFQKELTLMTEPVETLNIDALTAAELGTLLMFQNGINVREKVAKNTFYKHKKTIKRLTGWDISAENIERLDVKPRPAIILQPATPELFPGYQMPEEA